MAALQMTGEAGLPSLAVRGVLGPLTLADQSRRSSEATVRSEEGLESGPDPRLLGRSEGGGLVLGVHEQGEPPDDALGLVEGSSHVGWRVLRLQWLG